MVSGLPYRSLPSFLVIKLNEPLNRIKSRYDAHSVFAPSGHYQKNAFALCGSKVEVSFFTFNDLHAKIHGIAEDNLLRFLRRHTMAAQVPDVRIVPIELDLRAIHSFNLSSVPLL